MKTYIAWILIGYFAYVSSMEVIVGHNFALSGYDVRNASTIALEKRGKFELFQETFNFNQTYQRPNDTTVYLVPDQLNAYYLSIRDSQSATQIDHELQECQEEELSSFSLGLGFNVGNFGIKASYDRTQGYIHNQFQETLNFMAFGLEERDVAKMVVGPYILFQHTPLLDEILNEIPSCPKTPQDLNNVKLFIESYGHIFPTEIILGGTYKIVTSLNSYIFQEKDISWITEQLSLTFHYYDFDLNAGGFQNRSDIHIDDLFKNASYTHTFFDGGDRQSNDTLQAWFDSLIVTPAIVGGSFRPISDLITDDENKRKILEQMVAEHADTGNVVAPSCATLHEISQEWLPEIQGYIHLGGFDSLSESTKAGLFNHLFNNETWSNPIYPNYTFAVPSTVGVWDNPESVDQNMTYIAMSKEEYQVQLSSRVSFSDPGFIFSGSESDSYYVYSYYYDYRNEVMTEMMRWITWYDIELIPDIRFNMSQYLNPYAAQMINRLGSDLNDTTNRNRYTQYLETYGDQVVTRVSMGLRVHQKTYINKAVLTTISISQFHEDSESSFLGIFGSKSDYDDMMKSISNETRENARFEVKIEGGVTKAINLPKLANGYYNFTLQDLNSNLVDWEELVLTAKDSMQPLKYYVTPIYEFIYDPVIRENMKIMVQEFIQNRVNQTAFTYSANNLEHLKGHLPKYFVSE